MSELLTKGNADKLSAKDRRELDALLNESQDRMLHLALAVMARHIETSVRNNEARADAKPQISFRAAA